MVKEGFGQAMVPVGITRTFGFRSDEMLTLSPRIKRQVHIVSRKSVAGIKSVHNFSVAMQELSKAMV